MSLPSNFFDAAGKGPFFVTSPASRGSFATFAGGGGCFATPPPACGAQNTTLRAALAVATPLPSGRPTKPATRGPVQGGLAALPDQLPRGAVPDVERTAERPVTGRRELLAVRGEGQGDRPEAGGAEGLPGLAGGDLPEADLVAALGGGQHLAVG